MKIRTVLYLTIGAIVVSVLSIVYTTNREVLDRHIFLGHGLSMPVWSAILFVGGFSMLVPLLFGLARDARRFFRTVGARRQQNAARAREGDVAPLYSLVADYQESGAAENAKAVLNRIIAMDPKRSLNAYRQFRAICVREGAWDKAWEIQQRIEELLSGLGRPPRSEKKHHLAIRLMLARRHVDEGRPRDAIGVLRRIIRMEPAFVPAHLRLGRALTALGQPESAVEAWEEGWQATGHPIFLTTIEDHYLREEQPRRAIEALKSAVWKSRQDILPRFFLGKLYLRLEMLDEALAEFSRLRGRVAHFPALHYSLARIHERHGNYREAIRELETLLSQAEPLRAEYACATCARRYPEWTEHCERCGEWNTIGVDFREERGVEELGLSSAPVYTVEGQEG
jgi:tetratricopeptide (TPR) repeat protein